MLFLLVLILYLCFSEGNLVPFVFLSYHSLVLGCATAREARVCKDNDEIDDALLRMGSTGPHVASFLLTALGFLGRQTSKWLCILKSTVPHYLSICQVSIPETHFKV